MSVSLSAFFCSAIAGSTSVFSRGHSDKNGAFFEKNMS